MRPFRLLVTAAFLAVGLSACGANRADAVKAKVRQFATAVRAHDYGTLCRQVLAPQLLADIAAGGLSCERAMAIGLGRVAGARLVIGTVTVAGSSASVLTLTQAVGQRAVVATLRLSDTSAGWRISSLGSPVG